MPKAPMNRKAQGSVQSRCLSGSTPLEPSARALTGSGRRRACCNPALGGVGPRSHVSHEDGLVKDVTPHLWNHFRRTHPGVQMIPGAVYYHPDGRWVWITCQRPTVGMHWDFETDRLAAQFQYHARLQPAEIVHTPEVSLYWGRGGRAEMLARLNENFIAYEEPADWFFHTTWFWLHWWQFRQHGYDDMVEQIKFLNGELGLTGLE